LSNLINLTNKINSLYLKFAYFLRRVKIYSEGSKERKRKNTPKNFGNLEKYPNHQNTN